MIATSTSFPAGGGARVSIAAGYPGPRVPLAGAERAGQVPYGRDRDETLEFDDPITHWAELPTLPGTNVHYLLGEKAEAARANALRQGT
ncbi:hypothetical protein [Microbispora triticiradicis]|uniref:hypothetical protein n=1 Tax=Microbispora triticiradicis TaxID=2200763 RepID=UPI001AD78D29|nr:hypothetical protein [Microbispora triticiradicis]MBO4269838.1 hypothetical protein [Microbispora triticiradicis]